MDKKKNMCNTDKDSIQLSQVRPVQNQTSQPEAHQATCGPALRTTQVRWGERLMLDQKELGIFWACPQCRKSCDDFRTGLFGAIKQGKDVQAECPCGAKFKLVRAEEPRIQVVSNNQATAVISMLQRGAANVRRKN